MLYISHSLDTNIVTLRKSLNSNSCQFSNLLEGVSISIFEIKSEMKLLQSEVKTSGFGGITKVL